MSGEPIEDTWSARDQFANVGKLIKSAQRFGEKRGRVRANRLKNDTQKDTQSILIIE